MSYRLFQVDAFDTKPFAGNPAAVVLMDREESSEWMLDVAAEMNLSETAFVRIDESPFGLRWFTPTTEVRLCGHATLATAHTLYEHTVVSPDEVIEFDTLSGILSAQRSSDGWITLDFPSDPPQPADAPPELAEALRVEPQGIYRNSFAYLVLVDSEATVRQARPDMALLSACTDFGAVITAPAADSESYDFVSRFFAPAVGIDEDPVTGATHTSLAPFWGERLNKTSLRAYQASARGGHLALKLAGNRVHIGGQAVTIFRGELL